MDDGPGGIGSEAAPATALSSRRTQPFDVDLGAKIRALRVAANMSQKALGHAVGVSFQQLQKYEVGKDRISASTLFHIAAALDVPVGSLFGDASQPGLAEPVSGDGLSAQILVMFSQIRDDRVRKLLLALARALADGQAQGAPEIADGDGCGVTKFER